MNKSGKIQLLREMIKIRCFEERVAEFKLKNKIPGPVHTRIGEEAIDVGVCSALSKNDYIIGNFRSHGHMIAKGAQINPLMAEIFGKRTGTNGGKGGSMHVSDPSIGSLGASAIVGSGFGIACGAAFAAKYNNESRVSCVFFGDGATNEGTFHENLNLASIWKLPVLFLLENNGFAITTPLEKVSVSNDLFHRGKPFGILSKQIDGQNVEEVYKNVKMAVKHMNSGNGPVLLEAKTYRFKEHQEGEYYDKLADVGYRSKDDVKFWIENKDPINLFASKLISDDLIDKNQLKKIYSEENKKVSEAIKFALNSPQPYKSDTYKNIYV